MKGEVNFGRALLVSHGADGIIEGMGFVWWQLLRIHGGNGQIEKGKNGKGRESVVGRYRDVLLREGEEDGRG